MEQAAGFEPATLWAFPITLFPTELRLHIVGADPRTPFHVLKKDVRTPHHFDARGVRRDGRMHYDLERTCGVEPQHRIYSSGLPLPTYHVLLRYPKSAAAHSSLLILTAATRSAPLLCRRQRSHRSPLHHIRISLAPIHT